MSKERQGDARTGERARRKRETKAESRGIVEDGQREGNGRREKVRIMRKVPLPAYF